MNQETPLQRQDPAQRGSRARPNSAYPDISFSARMDSTEFRVHGEAHITLDDTHCRDCTVRGCITACPADLFVPTSDGGIVFNYELCFECGTCYLVCNEEGAITWTYPEGGHGVVFHNS